MSDLITRLEEAAEGSRELDAEISQALMFPTMLRWGDHHWRRGHVGGWTTLPSFTTSLDAALALAERVLPGSMWGFQQNTTDPAHPDVLPFSAWVGRIEAMGHSFQLAICAAILRANHKDKP